MAFGASLFATRMAACLSSSGVYSSPPIYVISKVLKLVDCLKAAVLPGFQVKLLDLPENFGKDYAVTEKYVNILKRVEIAVCDVDTLVKTHAYMTELKWAHTTWAGVESLFKTIPQKPQFVVTKQSGEAFSSLIAEYVVCQMLNFERSFLQCWKNQESKTWIAPEHFGTYRSLGDITVGILGVGNMANGIAKFLKYRGTVIYGFGKMPRPTGAHLHFDGVFTKLEDILPKCDYLCNTLPSTPLTSGMLNNSMLEKCKKNAVFINVGRGNIISEQELVQALKKKWISGAVLDVFEEEPLPKSSELWEMPQVMITPHVAAISKPEHIADDFFKNYIKYIDGHGLQNVVNWSSGY